MTDVTVGLAELHAGQRLRGLAPGQVVTVVAVDPIDAGLVEVRIDPSTRAAQAAFDFNEEE